MRYLLLSLLLSWHLSAGQIVPQIVPLFTSQDKLAEKLVSEIRQEKESVLVAVYSFSHKKIVKALKEARKRGVQVELIVDPFCLPRQQKSLQELVDAGVKVYVWQTPHYAEVRKRGSQEGDPKVRQDRGILHHKFCLLGNQKVWTGSFNFTYSADRYHAENAVLITDPGVSRAYSDEFVRIRNQSQPFKSQ